MEYLCLKVEIAGSSTLIYLKSLLDTYDVKYELLKVVHFQVTL